MLLVSVAMVLAIVAGQANAARGEVVKRKSGCDYFVVESAAGFAVLEWYGGNDPDEGDRLVGAFETYGMQDVFNATADDELRVWVEDFWLTRRRALEIMYTKCR